MNEISKVSDITAQDVADYLRISEVSQNDTNTINNLIKIAKRYILKYTGKTLEQLDDSEDFVIVILILCQDMWDNRTFYVENTNINKVVESILDMHSVNLL